MDYEYRRKREAPERKLSNFTVRFTACAVVLCIIASAKYAGFGENQLDKLSHIISENQDFSFIKSKLKRFEKPFSVPVSGTVTRGFSDDHKGTDIASEKGTPVYAAADGIVAEACENGAYGNCVQIIHPDGKLTLYAHLDSISVKKDDNVRKGSEIGKTGSTGDSTGPHLHFEIQNNGEYIDPSKETEGL